MKRFLLFIAVLFAFTITANAQYYEWVGGDGSWGDPNNWIDDYGNPGVPGFGADVNIGGFDAYVFYDGQFADLYSSISIYDSATLVAVTPVTVIDYFYLEEFSTVELYFEDLNYDFDGIIEVIGSNGTYDISGSIRPQFGGGNYMPQTGDQIVVATANGSGNICNVALNFDPFVFFDNGSSQFEVVYDVTCDTPNQMTLNVGDINYTGAKSWDGEAGNGLWITPENWDPNGVPDQDDYVIINKMGGATVITGGISQDRISLGSNNMLTVTGNISLSHNLKVNETASLNWTGGTLQKRIDGDFPHIENWGVFTVNGVNIIDTGTISNNFNGVIEMNGNINLNDGRLFNINGALIKINFDNLTIGYTSAGQHRLFNAGATIEKTATSGSGISNINVTLFENLGSGILSSQQGTLAIGEDFTNTGILTGIGNFSLPPAHIEEGTVAPGNSPGTLTFVGNLTTSVDATLDIEIDGPNPGSEYDQILVTNFAKLEGSIDVTLGYLPPNDASFEIIIADNIISCDFPAQVTSDYNGTSYTFDVICANNKLYLNGPGATLSTPNTEINEFKIYPNPVSDILNIKSETPIEGSWTIYNHLGQMTLNGTLNGTNTIIQTNGLQTGFYALQIKDQDNNTVLVKKIIAN